MSFAKSIRKLRDFELQDFISGGKEVFWIVLFAFSPLWIGIVFFRSYGATIFSEFMDNLSIDSGKSGLGTKGDPFGDGWWVHQLGLQRGWKLVENAANLGALKTYKPGQCAVFVAPAKVVSATGVPSRILAMCK